MKKDLGNKIRTLRKQNNLTQDELANKLGYANRGCISHIENNRWGIHISMLPKFADALNTTVADLVGESDESTRMAVVGEVSCGYNGTTELSYDTDYEYVPTEWFHNQPSSSFFLLRAKSNSMSPYIQNGDLVLVKKQSACDYSGQVAVCFYDQEFASLKEIRYGDGFMDMIPYNPSYETKRITGEELNRTYILGVVWRIIRVCQ